MRFTSVLVAGLPMAFAQNTYVSSTEEVYQWDANWNRDIQIHTSCNHSQYAQILEGWTETKILSQHARDHASLFGSNSEFFTKWFGENTSNAEVVGWFDNILNQDKTGVLFRCDDIDGNCHQDGWAGHWRGENATDETVICDLSYTSRQRLSQVCTQGWTVATGKTAAYWSGDLLHRLWHTDIMGQGTIDHYADTYEECLELALDSPEEAVRNTATLRYFAIDVYAFDIALPGVGCSGDDNHDDHDHDAASQSVQSGSSTATTTAGAECHTHADGVVHCS